MSIERELDALEDEAKEVLGNPALTAFERRRAIERLFRRYNVLVEYQKALAAYIRRMRGQQEHAYPTVEPDQVVRDILDSPEFNILRAALLAILIAAIYRDGPRDWWVPMVLVPTFALSTPTLRV